MVKRRSVKRNAKNARGLGRERLIFVLLVLIRPQVILSESLAQASMNEEL